MQNELINTVVIGGGVIGLTVARALSSSAEVALFEKDKFLSNHASSRNSEVIHSGIYYKKNTLKSKLCIKGNDMLYEYMKAREIPFKNCKKLIVACSDRDLEKLKLLEKNAVELNIKHRNVNPGELRAINSLKAKRAIELDSAGIFSSHTLINTLEQDIQMNGSHIVLNSEVTKINKTKDFFRLEIIGSDKYEICCKNVINCAGFFAQNILNLEEKQDLNIEYYKGYYYKYNDNRLNSNIKKLIYPLPQKNGLGIHLTLGLDGQIKFGPNVERVFSMDYSFHPSEERLEYFFKSISQYLEIDRNYLQPDYTGIRTKYFDKDGNNDFKFIIRKNKFGSSIHLLGIDSPGLTSSLAIGEYIKNLLMP